MNKRRLAGIARWLERGAKEKNKVAGFDMHHFGGCGTTCCIAGTASVWWGGNKRTPAYYDILGAEVLGLRSDILPGGLSLQSGSRAWELFFGVDRATPKHAAKVIRHLIATGEFDWSVGKD